VFVCLFVIGTLGSVTVYPRHTHNTYSELQHNYSCGEKIYFAFVYTHLLRGIKIYGSALRNHIRPTRYGMVY